MAGLQFPVTHHDGAVLGSEYCSGYIDQLGKWNTGFYCPTSDGSGDVFCCGSPSHKYCCTRRDQVLQQHLEGVTMAVGVAVGASTAILLLTILSCVCCPACPLGRRGRTGRKQGSRPGSVYRLASQESALSGGTQSYSLSCAGESVPPSPGLPRLQALEPGSPPPYHVLPRASYLLVTRHLTPDLLSEAGLPPGLGEEGDDDLLHSTKF